MTIEMYDAVDPLAIPTGASAVAGYLDGALSAWPAGSWSRFATVRKLRITVTGRLDADVADVETGDLTPMQGATWAREKHARGEIPRIYCNLSTWPAVQAASAGIPVLWWIANPTGVPHLVPGSQATQDRWSSLGQAPPGTDLSTVDPSFFPEEDMTPEEHGWLADITAFVDGQVGPNFAGFQQVVQDAAAIRKMLETAPPGSPLTADQAAALTQIPALVAVIGRIEAALKGA